MIRHALVDKFKDMTPEEILDNDVVDEVMELLVHEVKQLKRRQQEIEALETMIALQQNEIEALQEANSNDSEHVIRLMQHTNIKAIDIMEVRCYIKKLKEGPRLYLKDIGEKHGKRV